MLLKQSDLAPCCLSRPFWQTTSFRNFRTSTVYKLYPSTLNHSDHISTETVSSTTTPSTLSASGRLIGQSDAGPIRAPAPMWRCSRIMHMQRELHPTILSSLEGIVDQMVWFRENWYEEVLRQLRQGLTKCYAVAFENRASGKLSLVLIPTFCTKII